MFKKLLSSLYDSFKSLQTARALRKETKLTKVRNEALKQSFFNNDLDGVEQALKAGADPNLSMYFLKSPNYVPFCFKEDVYNLFSKKGFHITFMDILLNRKIFSSEDEKMSRLISDYGGHGTEEGVRAFEYWKQVEDVVERENTPKEFYCQMSHTCQQLKGTTTVGTLRPRHIQLPEKCCPHWDCPNRDRSTFGTFFANGRWWRERY